MRINQLIINQLGNTIQYWKRYSKHWALVFTLLRYIVFSLLKFQLSRGLSLVEGMSLFVWTILVLISKALSTISVIVGLIHCYIPIQILKTATFKIVLFWKNSACSLCSHVYLYPSLFVIVESFVVLSWKTVFSAHGKTLLSGQISLLRLVLCNTL